MKLMTGLTSVVALMLWAAGPAQSQSLITFVSGTGDDGNPCSRASPCQTFGHAMTQTQVNGEIHCIDAGVFNPVSTPMSVTIDCHEAFATVQFTGGGTGVFLQVDNLVNDARKTVRLRNLNLTGLASGATGILITGAVTGTTVVIEDCVIDGATGRGIDDQRSGGGKLIVTNTTIRNNGGAGISVLPAGGSSNIQVLLNNVRSYHNGTGAQFGNLVRAAIDQSAFTANTGAGILTVAGAVLDIDRSTMTHNANGVQAAGGVVALANSNIKLNTSQGVNVSGGTVVSFGNNRIAFNASPGTAPGPAGAASSDLGQQ